MDSLSGLASVSGVNPEHVGRVRILVAGNTGCGKTSLSHFLATGDVLKKTSTTVGCNVFVKLVEYPEEVDKNGTPTRTRMYFVELWDVGAHPRYQQTRRLFYEQLNGVILVHDLSARNSKQTLEKWATEIAGDSTFAAQFPADVSDQNFGGLSVPVLVIGNKADLSVVAQNSLIANCRWLTWWPGLLSFIAPLFSWQRFSPSGLTPRNIHGKVLSSSAWQGSIDKQAVNEFFFRLIERRYYSGTKPGSSSMGFFSALPAVNQWEDRQAISGRLDAEDDLDVYNNI